MTEAQIELRAERFMDQLDRWFMTGEITKNAYEKAVRDLDVWVTLKLASTWRDWPPTKDAKS